MKIADLGWETLDVFVRRPASQPLRELLRHWQEIRGDRSLPPREAIDPTEMPHVLPYIWFGDVDTEASVFTYRLAGDLINHMHGGSIRGCTIEDVVPEERRNLIKQRFQTAVRTPAAIYTYGLIYAELESAYLGERLVLPVGLPDGTVTHLIGASYWSWGGESLDLPEYARDGYFEVSAAL